MITKFIKYNGVTTKDLGLRLLDDITFSSSEKSVEFIEIDGVNGAKIKDNKRLSLVDRSFPFVVYDSRTEITEIINKLNNTFLNAPNKWCDFELSWDSNYLYKAFFYESFEVTGTLKARKKCILNFKIHPIKYLKTGLNKQVITRGQRLVNPTKRLAKPLIKLRGTGDVTLNINTQIFRLKGVQGHIVIDSETQTAEWDNKEPQYDKVFSYPFPHLELGNNTINWDNANFICEIIPRWEELA